MDESEHCKEVYAHHGLAMYRAQCVEQSIVQLLVFFDFFRENVPQYATLHKWEHDFDVFDRGLSSKTMGQLIKRLASINALDASLEPLLRESLVQRNHLAHRFFVEHAMDFLSEPGRDRMIQELEAARELFNSVERVLNPITYALCEKYGLTEERRKQIEHEMLAEAKASLTTP
jgi:hypothetical protein